MNGEGRGGVAGDCERGEMGGNVVEVLLLFSWITSIRYSKLVGNDWVKLK